MQKKFRSINAKKKIKTQNMVTLLEIWRAKTINSFRKFHWARNCATEHTEAIFWKEFCHSNFGEVLMIAAYIENVTGNPRHINDFGYKLGFHPECICKFAIKIILELSFFVLNEFHNWSSNVDLCSRQRNSSGKHRFQMKDQSVIAAPH